MAEIWETKSEVVTSPIYGLRAWGIDRWNILYSLSSVNEPWWPQRPMRAYCRRRNCQRENPPTWSCYCGVHAYKNTEDVAFDLYCAVRGFEEAASMLGGIPCDADFAVGIVALWGKIIEHESGWRAERAYPVWLGIFKPKYSSGKYQAADISEFYGVPVEVLEVSPGDLEGVNSVLRAVLQRVQEECRIARVRL